MKKLASISALFLLWLMAPSVVSKPTASGKYSAAQIAKGKALFKQLQCVGCHAVDENGGCLAPELNGVTLRHDERYLTLRLSSAKGDEDRFIKLIGHKELVPHPRFPRTQVKALIAYLSTFKPEKPSK